MKTPDTPPNIILIITDQHRADHLGCYGNEIVKTPNIDRIADTGTRFDRFYVSCPICMPNRATLMTGRMPSLHGVRQNGISLSFQEVTFTELMVSGGYRTALIGKSHLQGISEKPVIHGLPNIDPQKKLATPDLMEARRNRWMDGRYDQELRSTWEERDNFRPELPFYGFQHLALAIGHSDNVWGDYANWLSERHPDPASMQGPENALPSETNTSAPQAWRTAVPEELYPTTFIKEETVKYLKDHAASHGDKPFLLQCSFPDPHHPFTPPGKYFDMYDPADIPLPASYIHPQDKWPPHLANILSRGGHVRSKHREQRAFGVTENEARAAIALNYGSITMIDDAIGTIMKTLAETEQANNTIIIFTTDHGDFMGDHQLLLKGALHYQGLIRVPFIISDPNNDNAPMVTSNLSGTIDIAGTILELAGINKFNGMQSKSLRKIAEGRDLRSAMLIEESQRRGYMGLKDNFRARTILHEDWRLTLYSGVEWGEFYNLKDDPNEFDNLWDEPSKAKKRADLLEVLIRESMDMGENSPVATTHGP
ncbi:MAG: sulfatase-like hydrolase/transferase [Pseudomonadota bacterium]|nr:sulfatase-like hydrolase/transferase [Pseudomonadota bacterium]